MVYYQFKEGAVNECHVCRCCSKRTSYIDNNQKWLPVGKEWGRVWGEEWKLDLSEAALSWVPLVWSHENALWNYTLNYIFIN